MTTTPWHAHQNDGVLTKSLTGSLKSRVTLPNSCICIHSSCRSRMLCVDAFPRFATRSNICRSAALFSLSYSFFLSCLAGSAFSSALLLLWLRPVASGRSQRRLRSYVLLGALSGLSCRVILGSCIATINGTDENEITCCHHLYSL